MKKFGTPMRAAPGTASEKVGLVTAGDPSELFSRGVGRVTSGVGDFEVVEPDSVGQSRPEVEVEPETWARRRPEVEHGREEPVPPFCAFVRVPVPVWAPLVLPLAAWPGVAVAVAPGVAVEVADGEAPGVAVADSVGAGVAATVVSTGEAIGEGEAVVEGVAAGVVAGAVAV